jgi:hypothetical protein
VYSSQVGAWGDLVSVQLDVILNCDWNRIDLRSGALVGDGVHFLLALSGGGKIVKYNLGTHCFSTIDLPVLESKDVVLMSTEDGLLGLASTRASTLYLWSRMVNGEGVAGWVQCRVVELPKVSPVTAAIRSAKAIGFAEGVNVIFVSTNVGTFIINLNTRLAKKVSRAIDNLVIPFTGFKTPGMVLALCFFFLLLL